MKSTYTLRMTWPLAEGASAPVVTTTLPLTLSEARVWKRKYEAAGASVETLPVRPETRDVP